MDDTQEWYRMYGGRDAITLRKLYDDAEKIFMNNERNDFYQQAPYPTILEELVSKIKYRPGWDFSLQNIDRGQGSEGLTFIVTSLGYDTYNSDRGESYRVNHYFIVPAAGFKEQAWVIWLRDCLVQVETHECNEFFQVDGERPFAPHHGPGEDPYATFLHGTDLARRTNFRGEVQES